MCGILGVLSLNPNLHSKVPESLDQLKFRGPDYQKWKNYGRLSLGHTRLSIVDNNPLSNQPLSFDNRYTLVYNGEVYNHNDLRLKMESKGIKFITKSDTEVVLRSFVYFGKTCVDRFNGFFSFAIFDKFEQILYLYRDRYGIKPLYLYQKDEDFIFSSELKAFSPFEIDKSIDKVSVLEYFQFGYVPKQNTGFNYIRQLTPGSFIEIRFGEKKGALVSKKKYYSIDSKIKTCNNFLESESVEEIKEKLTFSVASRLESYKPVGCFLSGGLDSSIISLIAKKLQPNLETFSLGFKDNVFFDETNYAKIVSESIKSKHHEVLVNQDDLMEGVDSFFSYNDELLADSSSVAFNIISRYAKQHVGVVLSGDGADELFSGYYKHMALNNLDTYPNLSRVFSKIFNCIKYFPNFGSKRVSELVRKLSKYNKISSMPVVERYFYLTKLVQLSYGFFSDNFFNYADFEREKERLMDYYQDYSKSFYTGFNRYLYSDFKYNLLSDMLRKVDSMSMANSLEVRVPFLDYKLVDYVFSLPEKFKIKKLNAKYLLRKAYEKELPKAILKRNKKGFEVPLKIMLYNILKQGKFSQLISRDFIEHQGIFEWEHIKFIREGFYKESKEISTQLWAIIVFNNWWNKYQI